MKNIIENISGSIRVIEDIDGAKDEIEALLKKYACSAEHNYYCYKYNIDKGYKPYVLVIDGCAILTKRCEHDNIWYFVVEPLAPQEKKASLLFEGIEYAFSEGAKKVTLELESNTRKQLLKKLAGTNYKANHINYTLIWPVFNMSEWSGDTMNGQIWKDIRYYWNKFFRNHKVEFINASDQVKDKLLQLVNYWKKNRTTGDKAYTDYYMHAIEKNFEGYDINRIMIVDGKVAAMTAGFISRPGYYYSTIGLYDKSIDRCNEIANMDDLMNLKKLGYKIVDFGGQETKSLEFKKKFHPTYYYKTHVFSVVKWNR